MGIFYLNPKVRENLEKHSKLLEVIKDVNKSVRPKSIKTIIAKV